MLTILGSNISNTLHGLNPNNSLSYYQTAALRIVAVEQALAQVCYRGPWELVPPDFETFFKSQTWAVKKGDLKIKSRSFSIVCIYEFKIKVPCGSLSIILACSKV